MAGVENRVALVTGASRGIGRATAELLAARGAKVMGVARSTPEPPAEAFEFVCADLASQQGCKHVIEVTEQQFGPIEIFVCNHGVGSAKEKEIWEQNENTWTEIMRTNLDGPFFLTRQLLPAMLEKNYGRIVYTSSTAGLVAEPSGSAYNSSKHGLLGLMRSVAIDAGKYGVTANAVLPGWVRTEMAERSAAVEARQRGVTKEQIWQERAALYPAERVVTQQEVAELIAFLASQESSGVSGEAIRVALGGVI